MKRYDPSTEYRLGSVFAGMSRDDEGGYVRYEDAALLLDALQQLSKFFLGEFVSDPRGQDEIDRAHEAAEVFAKDVLARLSPVTANARIEPGRYE